MKDKIEKKIIDTLDYLVDRMDKLEIKTKKIEKKNKKLENKKLDDKKLDDKILIKMIDTNKNGEVNNDFGEILMKTIMSEINKEEANKSKENDNFLNDSDDDIDDNISINDVILKKPNSSDSYPKIVELKQIINKSEITSIDDFIEINKYFQKIKKVKKSKNTKVLNTDVIENKLFKYNNKFYTINLEKVEKINGPLIKLKKMIGLTKIKNDIIDLILYYLIYFNSSSKNNEMLHMSLEGSPGCGKTKLAKIISKILTGLGILENDNIVYAKRTDLIGKFLGETGFKTQNIINKAKGGVLFIDEAYSLGGNDEKDIYSKECLDILNQNLSENKNKFICIIAGYTKELETNFFSANPGLTRRFPFRFKIDTYSSLELRDIFIRKIYKLDWKIDNDINNINLFFEKNHEHFKFFGGDIDTLIQDIKYSHSRRIACSHPVNYKIINNDDLIKAIEKFIGRRKNNNFQCLETMYL
jgi:stage V sporulation protein K